jgi:hypothetical protein
MCPNQPCPYFFESYVGNCLWNQLQSLHSQSIYLRLCAPLTVVTRITPFTPCSPYNAAPWAPLRTLRLSINSGGNCCNAAADEIALSITIKASLFPVIERDPLSTILVPPFTHLRFCWSVNQKLYLLMIVQHLG